MIILLTLPPGAPLRDPETGAIIGTTPFMDSLLFIITLIFLVSGICYGIGAGTIKSSNDVIAAITKTFAGLAGLVFMLLMISQFIAYFNYTQMPTVAAVAMAEVLERANIGALPLLVGLILVIMFLDIIIPGVVPKWAIFAPVFIPIFTRLGVAPQTVLAAYRVGRFARKRHHAADGVPAVHGHGRAALPEERRPGHDRRADAALHADHCRGLDPVLRHLVHAGHSAWTWISCSRSLKLTVGGCSPVQAR